MQAPSEMAEQHSICWQKNKIMLVRKHHLHIYSGSRERPFILGFYSKAHIMYLSIWKKMLTPLNKQTWNRRHGLQRSTMHGSVWRLDVFIVGWGYGVSLKHQRTKPRRVSLETHSLCLYLYSSSFATGLDSPSVLSERSSCFTHFWLKSNKPFILTCAWYHQFRCLFHIDEAPSCF